MPRNKHEHNAFSAEPWTVAALARASLRASTLGNSLEPYEEKRHGSRHMLVNLFRTRPAERARSVKRSGSQAVRPGAISAEATARAKCLAQEYARHTVGVVLPFLVDGSEATNSATIQYTGTH
ncbi:hypothetical protein CSHISOI_00155 [Colletotrichum shisoi]|uniref:Uncharacterized protein n=1 Tax=Colletotrichum shisoi TaxID=2078593 RepID=A0A5Q4C7H8_9PEZI|nr:hypothetical protein CSHISOI_00155 [Colletotrichum shisoi]